MNKKLPILIEEFDLHERNSMQYFSFTVVPQDTAKPQHVQMLGSSMRHAMKRLRKQTANEVKIFPGVDKVCGHAFFHAYQQAQYLRDAA